ncbi:choloylglycine hydrolase, partial [Francisella tularensis subsp. holarctica]|nr:choloylglycine hydrolase [Francisella tularensis subsp. holarctica]
TSYSVVDDLSNRDYYFRTWDNNDIRKVDLIKIDFAKAKYQADTIFGQADYQEIKFK